MQISENHMMSPFCACVLQQSVATLAGNRGLSEPASDHAADPAQRDQALDMLAGVMPGGQAGPFASAQARSRALMLPTGACPAAERGASPSAARSGAIGSAAQCGAVTSTGSTAANTSGGRAEGEPAASAGSQQTTAASEGGPRGQGPPSSRPRRVRVVPLNLLVAPPRPVIRIRRGAPVHTCSHEGAPPLTLERRCPGTSRARCGGTAYQWPQVCLTVRRWRRAS